MFKRVRRSAKAKLHKIVDQARRREGHSTKKNQKADEDQRWSAEFVQTPPYGGWPNQSPWELPIPEPQQQRPSSPNFLRRFPERVARPFSRLFRSRPRSANQPQRSRRASTLSALVPLLAPSSEELSLAPSRPQPPSPLSSDLLEFMNWATDQRIIVPLADHPAPSLPTSLPPGPRPPFTKILTKKIQTSFDRLETSAKRVQGAIGPIYGDTQRLQALNTNIDRALRAIERLREPTNLHGKEERIITAGPQKSGLSEFLNSLGRITEALSRLRSTNLRSNQQAASELGYLLSSGTQQLEKVFRDILKEDSYRVEPLNFIHKDVPFPALPREKVSRLALINTFTVSSAKLGSQYAASTTTTAQIYADVRGPYLSSSLENLAAASVSTAKKKVADALYRRGANGVSSYARATEALFVVEHENIVSIFARDDWSPVFRSTCRLSIGDLAKTLRDLNVHIKNNLTTDCFLAYEVFDIIRNLAIRLESQTGELKSLIIEALNPIRDTARSSFSVLLEDIRTKVGSMMSLPQDGSAVIITTDTMTRLQSMTEYLSPLSTLMQSLGDNWTVGAGSTSSPSLNSFDIKADGTLALTKYSMDTIDTLLQSLESKGRALLQGAKGKSLIGAFLANNVVIVERMIRSSELFPLLSRNASVLEGWRKKGISLYLEAWKEPSACLLDVQYTNRGGQRPPSGNAGLSSADILKNLNSKDKDALKEKFRNFNLSFEDALSRHRTLRLEREVASVLAREVQAMIEPLYNRFWDRYHDIDKGKGKYVKYDKGQLTAVLAQLG